MSASLSVDLRCSSGVFSDSETSSTEAVIVSMSSTTSASAGGPLLRCHWGLTLYFAVNSGTGSVGYW